MNKVIVLSPDINAHVIHFAPIAVGAEIHRVIYEIYSDPTKPSGGLLKEYEVWLSETYVEDHDRLTHGAEPEEVLSFANNYVINRYRHSGNNVPVENGAYLTHETGEIRGNPHSFALKTSDQTKLVKTTLMLPRDTIEWVKTYSDKKGIGMGEAIRRVVSDYQAGTVSSESVVQKEVNEGQSD